MQWNRPFLHQMNLLINGFPKSGNHALQRACSLLGFAVDVNHLAYSPLLLDGFDRCIFIKRDPRNVLISFMRHVQMPLTVENFIATCRTMSGMFDDDGPFVEKFKLYEAWMRRARVFVTSYEALIASPDEMSRIAGYLAVKFDRALWLELERRPTLTWNQEHSDYRKIWAPELAAFWRSSGGLELQERWGYLDA